MPETNRPTHAPPEVLTEQRHAERRLFSPAPDGSLVLVSIDKPAGCDPLVSLARVRLSESAEGRAMTMIAGPLTVPLRDAPGHLRAMIEALRAAAVELESEAA